MVRHLSACKPVGKEAVLRRLSKDSGLSCYTPSPWPAGVGEGWLGGLRLGKKSKAAGSAEARDWMDRASAGLDSPVPGECLVHVVHA